MATVASEQLTLLDKIELAYRQAEDKWLGCDWPTAFGESRLNLNGLKSHQAVLMARATSGQESTDWRAAVEWLSRVEADARIAQDLARQALALALDGKAVGAVVHAQRACAIEANYRDRLIWQPLRKAIEAALGAALFDFNKPV